MADTAPVAKICSVCKQDCSTRRRSKDAKGRYVCGQCEDRLAAESASKQAATSSKPEQASAPADELFEVEGLDPAAMLDLVRAEAGAAPTAPPPALVFEDTPAGGETDGARKCPKCGYSMRGLTSKTCPECGAEARYKSGRTHALEAIEDERRSTVRMAYQRPIIMAACGLVGLGIVLGVSGRGDRVLGELVFLAVRIPAGIIAYLLCCAMFLGFNAPVHLTALQLAGVYSVMAAIWALVDSLPLGIFRLAVVALYIMLLMHELDLDRGDAVIMALLTGGVMVGISLLVMFLFPGLF